MMLVCTTTGCVTENEPDGLSLNPGDPLPQFVVEMNDGESISTESLKGKVPVIVFFNTGCSDCRQELPVINNLFLKYKDDIRVKIVPIAREESADEIKEYWASNGLSMPWSAQENRDIYSLFAPSIIPRIYIADPQGIIRFAYDDASLPSVDTLEKDIDTCLATTSQD